jgi:hypothetical protein
MAADLVGGGEQEGNFIKRPLGDRAHIGFGYVARDRTAV